MAVWGSIIGVLAGLVLFVSPAFAGLVTNGTFDAGCAGWVFTGASFCSATTGNPGGAAVINDSPGVVPTVSQAIAGLVVGEDYEITLDANTFFNCCNNPSIPGAGVEIDGQLFEYLVVNNQPYETHTFNFTYSGGSNILVLSAQRNGTDSDAQVDNVDINLIPQGVPLPATILLLGGGIATMVALRSRKK